MELLTNMFVNVTPRRASSASVLGITWSELHGWSSLTMTTIAAGASATVGDATGEGEPFRLATMMAVALTTMIRTATPISSLGRPPSPRGAPSLLPDR
jgi:hypothetical protein